jgi:Flp pilus assembly protein TadG
VTARVDDRGVAGSEVLVVGVVVFVIGTLMLTNFWAVLRAKVQVATAAREATRAWVEAESTGEAQRSIDAAVRAALGPSRAAIADVRVSGGALVRCQPVTVTVGVDVPVLRLPGVHGGVGSFRVAASHTEIVDPWRTGLGTDDGEPCAA